VRKNGDYYLHLYTREGVWVERPVGCRCFKEIESLLYDIRVSRRNVDRLVEGHSTSLYTSGMSYEVRKNGDCYLRLYTKEGVWVERQVGYMCFNEIESLLHYKRVSREFKEKQRVRLFYYQSLLFYFIFFQYCYENICISNNNNNNLTINNYLIDM
jgi:hypothetical protein